MNKKEKERGELLSLFHDAVEDRLMFKVRAFKLETFCLETAVKIRSGSSQELVVTTSDSPDKRSPDRTCNPQSISPKKLDIKVRH